MLFIFFLKYPEAFQYRLYIVEGAITIVVAVCCVFLIPENYESAYFLNEEDKEIMRKRAEETKSYSGGKGHYNMTDVRVAVSDAKTWVHGGMQVCAVTILYGLSFALSHSYSPFSRF